MSTNAQCYSCIYSDVCPNRETFLAMYDVRHYVMIDPTKGEGSGSSDYNIRVEYRYKNGPALDKLLSSLGVFGNSRVCSLRRPCPIPQWWSDPVLDHGIPAGYIEPLCIDARDCEGNRLPYKDYPFRPYGFNCGVCPYRGIDYSSMQEELIQSSASTFFVGYVNASKGDVIKLSDIIDPGSLADGYMRCSDNPESVRITGESDFITIYYCYGQDQDLSSTYETSESLREKKLYRTITLATPKVVSYDADMQKVMETDAWKNLYSNITLTCGPVSRKNDDLQYNQEGTGFTQGDVMFDSGDEKYNTIILSAVLGDNIKFDITCPGYMRMSRASRSYLANTAYSFSEEIATKSGYYRVYHVEIESFTRSFGFKPIFIDDTIGKDYEMTYCMKSPADFYPADWGLISGLPVDLRVLKKSVYNDSEVSYPNNLPSYDMLYRPGLRLLGYTTDYEKRSNFDPEIDYGYYGAGIDDAKSVCFISPKKVDGVLLENYDVYAMWGLERGYLTNTVNDVMKEKLGEEAVANPENPYDFSLNVPYAVTDIKLIEMFQEMKNRLAEGFEVDVYMAPEIKAGNYMVVEHLDNPDNMSPTVTTFERDEDGNMILESLTQLLPLNLDLAVKMDVQDTAALIIIYPKDFTGMAANRPCYSSSLVDLNIVPAEVKITEYYNPSENEGCGKPNVSEAIQINCDGIYPEDLEYVHYAYDEEGNPYLEGEKSSNYTITSVDYLFRYKVDCKISVKQPTNAAPVIPDINMKYTIFYLARPKDTLEIQIPIPTGFDVASVFMDEDHWYDPYQDISWDADDSDLTIHTSIDIKLFDLSDNHTIDIELEHDCSNETEEGCNRCENWIDTSQYDWISWTPSCENYQSNA